ncbi:MAG: hypothetical protein ABJN40_07415 [Sneathiella sp.]
MIHEDWHDEILQEEFPSILECLGSEGVRIFEITKTQKGFCMVECCDGYYGTTLNKDQMLRLSEELKKLAESFD